MLLQDFVRRYVGARDISDLYGRQLRWTADKFERYLGRPAELADLSDDAVNQWLAGLLASHLARRSVKDQRTNLVVLWREAHRDGMVDRPPSRVRKISVPPVVPHAVKPDKISELLGHATALKGRFQRSRVERGPLLKALLLTNWHSGLRLGDLVRLERSWIGDDGKLVIIQNKTKTPLLCPLPPECLDAIAATFPPERRRIFGDAVSRRWLTTWLARVFDAAGLPERTRLIRRSAATAVEAQQPGAAMRFLGHKTHGLAQKHYIDPRLLDFDRPSPPPLEQPPDAA